jgi:hypothetical protein
MTRGGFAAGSALIEGITPYTVRRISVGDAIQGRDWPATIDADRLKAYGDFESLVTSQPWEVFDRLTLRPGQEERVVLSVALPELLCNVWADGLYGESAPEITFPADATRDTWDAIWSDNGGDDVLGWEATFATAMRGTGVIHVFREDDGRVRLEPISPGIYFPQLRNGSSRDVEAVRLAWEEDRADPDSDRSEIWQIKRLYQLDGEQLVVTTLERKSGSSTGFAVVDEERPEGVDFLPFVDTHAKRWDGRYWGISELARSMSLFAEIDQRWSQIGEILDYHGDPMLQVPASMLSGSTLAKGNQRALGLRDPREAYVARYITFDGKVADQIATIEKLVSTILLTNEVEEAYFGQIEGGSPSGTALRLRLQNYVKKVGRWERKDDERLRRLADLALRLADVTEAEARIPKIDRGSPLPADEEQEGRVLQSWQKAGLLSRKTTLRLSRLVDDPEEELRAIDADQPAPGSAQGLPAPDTRPGLEAAGVTVGSVIGAAADTSAALPPGV